MSWFGKRDQYATVAGFGVRVKDEREKDRNHLIETTFEVPLTHDLADEILPAMARDLFQDVGGDWTPKPELSQAGFNLAPAQQLMTVRNHPDLDAVFQTAGVSLRKITAKKGEANVWILSFTATWQLGGDNEAMTMIRALKSGVYLTFEAQQPTLMDVGQAPENEQVARVAADGVVTDITERKKRGRPRKRSVDAEAAAQQAHGVSSGDDEPATTN
jgi:hypothetical protein